MAVLCGSVLAQQAPYSLRDVNVSSQANSVLTLMTFTVVPDVTTSTLSISNASAGNPALTLFTMGGGATLSREVPIYLEGVLGYSRYDPKYLISDGRDNRQLPLRWNSASLSGGIGWDFPLGKEVWLRPILNIALGEVVSDLRIAEFLIDKKVDREINFLKHGNMTAYGYGASLMLDWERYRPESEIDVEGRFSYIHLQAFGSTDDAVNGKSDAISANVWGRYRAPTGLTVLDRPLRYVLEVAHTRFFGSQRDALGFDFLSSVGVGFEFDTSAHDVFVSRIRIVARRMFGQNAEGGSVGLSASF